MPHQSDVSLGLLARSLQLQSPWWRAGILLLAVVIATVGMLLGPDLPLRILYPIPVVAAAWLGGFWLSMVLAVGLPAVRALLELQLWHSQAGVGATLANAAVAALVLVLFGILAATAATALRRVATLEGILPICSVCKRIRGEDLRWEQLESYVSRHSGASFSHSLCPECLRRVYGNPLGG